MARSHSIPPVQHTVTPPLVVDTAHHRAVQSMIVERNGTQTPAVVAPYPTVPTRSPDRD